MGREGVRIRAAQWEGSCLESLSESWGVALTNHRFYPQHPKGKSGFHCNPISGRTVKGEIPRLQWRGPGVETWGPEVCSLTPPSPRHITSPARRTPRIS